MLIGIMSDSHGDADKVRQALALFDDAGAEHLIHCGDVGGVPVFEELVGRDLTFVWGNCDVATDAICAFLESTDLQAPRQVPTTVELGAKRFAVFHGHEPQFRRAEELTDVDYVCSGHTHEFSDVQCDGIRFINPGALYRARQHTVAVLDTETGKLTRFVIPR